jgi:aldehyde dehydrogenase (NAD+)
VLIEADIYTDFVKELINAAKELAADDFNHAGKIINKRQFERLIAYLQHGKIIFGGAIDEENLQIGLTIIENPDFDSALMHEEIFGPILPLVKYTSYNELIEILNINRYPLAVYLFSNDRKLGEKIIHQVESGAIGINNCLYHFVNHNLPFGGVMYSGNGHYHGKFSFDVFSHSKALVRSSNFPDFSMKYPPYGKLKLKLLKLLG